jgi:hypothetical protein
VFVGLVVAASAGVAGYLRHLDEVPLVVRCAAKADGTSWYLQTDQADTAALLAATSLRRGLPARATTIALATGLQESKLRNVTGGDRDSLGIFQQRPSQGWGTAEQIMDPVYATNAFYDALVKVDGYQDLPITEAAQAVQRSGFPEAYAAHEPQARAWASALYGYTPEAVTCTLGDPTKAGDPAAVTARITRDLGTLPTAVGADGSITVDATPMATANDADRLGWAVAHWAVAVAAPLEIVEVDHMGARWDRATGLWTTVKGAAGTPGQVRVVLASGS